MSRQPFRGSLWAPAAVVAVAAVAVVAVAAVAAAAVEAAVEVAVAKVHSAASRREFAPPL